MGKSQQQDMEAIDSAFDREFNAVKAWAKDKQGAGFTMDPADGRAVADQHGSWKAWYDGLGWWDKSMNGNIASVARNKWGAFQRAIDSYKASARPAGEKAPPKPGPGKQPPPPNKKPPIVGPVKPDAIEPKKKDEGGSMLAGMGFGGWLLAFGVGAAVAFAVAKKEESEAA